jgi:MinD superfamily P-loop ATPase
MAGVQAGYPDGIGKTPFVAEVDHGKCNGCGLCLPACNVQAMRLGAGEGRAFCAVGDDVCLGCGACPAACPKGAISLKDRLVRPVPPETRKVLFTRMLKERGRLTPYLVSDVKRKIRKWFKTSGR